MNMSCVPEGGMHYDWDLTYIIDGAYLSVFYLLNYFLKNFGLRNDDCGTCYTYPDFVR